MPTLVHEVKGRQVTVPEGSVEFYLDKGWKLVGRPEPKPAAKRKTAKSKAKGANSGTHAREAEPVPADADGGADDKG